MQLLNSAEYYDPHAVAGLFRAFSCTLQRLNLMPILAGLLKSFLRELPVHLLTRELHAEFIQVIGMKFSLVF